MIQFGNRFVNQSFGFNPQNTSNNQLALRNATSQPLSTLGGQYSSQSSYGSPQLSSLHSLLSSLSEILGTMLAQPQTTPGQYNAPTQYPAPVVNNPPIQYPAPKPTDDETYIPELGPKPMPGMCYTPTPTPKPIPKPYPEPTPTPTNPVAANKSARIWGDPHIDAANGGKYDFRDAGIFNILKDKGITLNTKMAQGTGYSIDTEAGLTVGNRTVHYADDGSIQIGFADPQNKSPLVELKDGETFDLGNNVSIKRNGNSSTLSAEEYKIQVDANKKFKDLKYIDIKVSSGDKGVLSDGVAPTGLLGETFDGTKTRQKGPLHNADTYRAANLFELPNTPTPTPTPTLTPTPTPTATPTPTPVTLIQANFLLATCRWMLMAILRNAS